MIHPALRWSAWSIFSILWTIGLVLPTGALDRIPMVEDMGNWRVVVAKILHVCVYAFWTVFTGWLRTPVRVRVFLLAFLMAHAVVTEWCQQAFPELRRHGSLRDAAIDHAGIVLGLTLSFRWWTDVERA